MGRIETIIDISDKRVAQNQIKNYFEKYLGIPRAVIACPGGLYRSERVATYLEARKLAICPYNSRRFEREKIFVGLAYRELEEYMVKNVNVIVLCDELRGKTKWEKLNRIVNEVALNTPILLLDGVDGQFTYLCWEATVE